MQNRTTMARSRSFTLAKMNSFFALLTFSVVGSTFAYYIAPYNIGANDPFSVEVNNGFPQEPSQKLFWSNGQGSNQVGGTGLWAHFTNKFPFLANMFGRLEAAPATHYGVPSTQYHVPEYQPQYYNQVPYYQQAPRNYVPFRDVAFTDDAVIVTPPHVPIAPPAPVPSPEPTPEGYQYKKPQYRLDLPQK